MKKVVSTILTALLICSVMLLMVACSGQEASDTVLTKSLDLAKSGAEEYVNEVENATADDAADLKKDGEELLKSLDEVTEVIDDDTNDLSKEAREEASTSVDELRKMITDAMAKLDTK